MLQPIENANQIFVVIIDEAYRYSDDRSYPQASEKYRQALDQEFQSDFRTANIGPGADLPAFVTALNNVPTPVEVVLGLFFSGALIKNNLDAWGKIYSRLRCFFSRPVLFARNGAAVLAVQAIFDELGELPKTIELLRYSKEDSLGYHKNNLAEIKLDKVISDNSPMIFLSRVVHLFEIEADGSIFRVAIDGKDVEIIRVNSKI